MMRGMSDATQTPRWLTRMLGRMRSAGSAARERGEDWFAKLTDEQGGEASEMHEE